MKSFRYYLDIDAENRDDAQSQLEDMAGDMSFGDLECIELPCDQFTYGEILQHFKIKDKYEAYDKIIEHFVEFDGFLCLHCSESVGNDSKDMLEHLQKHTKEELTKTDDGDDFEEVNN